MPRPKKSIPTFCIARSGRAFTKIDGRFFSLGQGDNPESRQRYSELLQKVLHGEPLETTGTPAQKATPRPTINEVALRFLTEHCRRYRTSSGTESAEVRCFKGVAVLLERLFGETVADDFGPLRLRAVREAMVGKGWTRRYINKQVGRLRLMFRVAVSWEMARPEVLVALDSVPPLCRGETTAPEKSLRRSVPQADLDTVRELLKGRTRDLFDLLLLTGARPGEILGLTTGGIERTGDVWRAELAEHKTSHHGKSRVLFFNASAQVILRTYLTADPDARLFKVRSDTFSNAIKDACLKAGVPPFVPHQLRHTVATRLADEMGTESAQRLLGHTNAAMTEHYSRAAEKKAKEAVQKLG